MLLATIDECVFENVKITVETGVFMVFPVTVLNEYREYSTGVFGQPDMLVSKVSAAFYLGHARRSLGDVRLVALDIRHVETASRLYEKLTTQHTGLPIIGLLDHKPNSQIEGWFKERQIPVSRYTPSSHTPSVAVSNALRMMQLPFYNPSLPLGLRPMHLVPGYDLGTDSISKLYCGGNVVEVNWDQANLLHHMSGGGFFGRRNLREKGWDVRKLSERQIESLVLSANEILHHANMPAIEVIGKSGYSFPADVKISTPEQVKAILGMH